MLVVISQAEEDMARAMLRSPSKDVTGLLSAVLGPHSSKSLTRRSAAGMVHHGPQPTWPRDDLAAKLV